MAQPSNLRVPETIFTDRFDYRLDLWRAGWMVCQYSFILFSCGGSINTGINSSSTLSCSRSIHSGILAKTNP